MIPSFIGFALQRFVPDPEQIAPPGLQNAMTGEESGAHYRGRHIHNRGLRCWQWRRFTSQLSRRLKVYHGIPYVTIRLTGILQALPGGGK